MDFNDFMEKWLERPILGLPLRMVLLCKWHRINAVVMLVGLLFMAGGWLLRVKPLMTVGLVISTPPFVCFLLLWPVGLLFMGLDRLFGKKRS